MAIDRENQKIPQKSNRILNLILVALALILLRVWYLEVIQYDKKVEESLRPQIKTILEPAKRGTIRDRFNAPLAINKIQYNVSVIYAPMRQIAAAAWERDSHGKKIKISKRKEYIARLSEFLGHELKMDPYRIEDLIHAKASLYHNLPFTLKEDLTEEEYYRLKLCEKDWIGLHVQRLPKRYYPLGKVGCDIIGYMGSINRQEYESILEEMQTLEIFLRECDEGVSPELPGGVLTQDQAADRLQKLREHAYSIHDYVGKAGIEGKFEQDLRGYHGKKIYYSDAKGNFLREMEGSAPPLPGNRLLLTISAELQAYAEKLLAQNEKIRDAKGSNVDAITQALLACRQPWIKGGSILAIDPKNGEILAMASYPRFDPNDFVPSSNPEINKQKQMNISHWFEGESYVGEIWDQKRPHERELYDNDSNSYQTEKKWMTWEAYLNFILPPQNEALKLLEKKNKIIHALEVQKKVSQLLTLSGQQDLYSLLNVLYKEPEHLPYGKSPGAEQRKEIENHLKTYSEIVTRLKNDLSPYFSEVRENYDKVLLVDLYRLAVNGELFSSELRKQIGAQTLAAYRDASAAKAVIAQTARQMTKELYRDIDFKAWRKVNEKDFLKEKRVREKELKQYAKPYIDYLDRQENEFFSQFWDQHGTTLLLTFLNGTLSEEGDLQPYLSYFNKWHEELQNGAHPEVSWRKSYDVLQKTLSDVDSTKMTEYLKTMRGFNDLKRPLFGRYRNLRKEGKQQLEKHLAAAFYPSMGYGYGRSQAYRQSAPQGSIFKLITAYAALAQRYQTLENKEITISKLNPLEMIDHTHRHGKDLFVGYHANGSPLPRFYKGGRLPKSTHIMGKLDLLKAIEHSSNPYFSLIAGDVLKSPEDLANTARLFSYGSKTGIELSAEIPGYIPKDLSTNKTGLYSMAIGQHSLVVTPMQSATMLSTIANGGKVLRPKIVKLAANPDTNELKQYPTHCHREVFMPTIIRKILLEGMRRVVVRTQEESLASLSRMYKNHPEAISDYIDLKDELVGKTSTAEVMEQIDLDRRLGVNKYTHVWFGGISFNHPNAVVFRDKFGDPELVVVAYLRFGSYGKEAAPVAAQIVQKWREIKQKRGLH